MSNNIFNYREVLREFKKCQSILNNFTDFDDQIQTQVNTESLEYEAKKLISLMQSYPSCIEYTSLNKMLAIFCLMVILIHVSSNIFL